MEEIKITSGKRDNENIVLIECNSFYIEIKSDSDSPILDSGDSMIHLDPGGTRVIRLLEHKRFVIDVTEDEAIDHNAIDFSHFNKILNMRPEDTCDPEGLSEAKAAIAECMAKVRIFSSCDNSISECQNSDDD